MTKTEVRQLSWDLPKWVEEYQEEHCKRLPVSGQDLNPGLLKRKTSGNHLIKTVVCINLASTKC
jgi:hypothetical protein